MKPSTIFEGTIADMRKQGQTIDYELVERITRAVLRERSVEEERASRLVDGFKTVCAIFVNITLQILFNADKNKKAEDPFFVGWPITEEDCPYTGLGTKCNRVCFYCHMKHVCMHCALKPRSAEPSADPLCPLRIPGCRCSTGAGPSIAEYYCNASDRFMGAYVQGARDEEFFRGEVENEEYFEETEGEDVIEDETEDDELLEESGNERLFGEIGGEEPLDDENEGEEIVDDEARRLYSPQSSELFFRARSSQPDCILSRETSRRRLKTPGICFIT